MKKSAPKKLTLSRETLQVLEKEVEAAVGGATTLCTNNCSNYCTCDSRNTCSSKYC